MPDTRLIAGPYRAPRCRPGRVLYCSYRGDVAVTGITDAPIPWPYHSGCRRKALPILCADLVCAVRVESVEAVAHHWRVSRWTVLRWRRHLGVDRFNRGTIELWKRQTAKLERARAARKCWARPASDP